jgi:hypothetical protein
MSDITIIRGDSRTFNVNIRENDGSPFDLTGYTVFFTVKPEYKSETDDGAFITKTYSNIPNPETGVLSIDLASTDTDIRPGEHWYDIQLKSSANRVSSTRKAKFIVLYDVTRRLS